MNCINGISSTGSFWTHQWHTIVFSNRSPVASYRECIRCGRQETELYDYSGSDVRTVWVEGKFVDVDTSNASRAYILADPYSAFHEKATEISRETGYPLAFYWMSEEKDWSELDGVRKPLLFMRWLAPVLTPADHGLE